MSSNTPSLVPYTNPVLGKAQPNAQPGLIGQTFPVVGQATQPTAPVNSTTISDLFNAIDQTPLDLSQAQSQTDLAQGDVAEGTDYTTASAIAAANARLATVSGTVQQAQEALQIRQTLGSQRAAVAAGGFQEGGTALNLLRSSTQQGNLQQQITGINAQLQSAGFAQQGAAATAEGAAATAAANSATTLAATDQAIGQQSKTNAVNIAASLGVSIPGLSGLSATNIPNANPVTTGTATPPTPQGLGFPSGPIL